MNLQRICFNLNKFKVPVRQFHAATINCKLPQVFTRRTDADSTCVTSRSLAAVHTKTLDIEKPSFLTRILNKIPFVSVDKTKLGIIGFVLYEAVVDNVNYVDFFEEFGLQDTFYSWFVVTELHIWMLMARSMAEGDDGRFVRNKIVQAMWSDVGLRAKKIGSANPANTRAGIVELSEQFQAAIVAYDEGIQSNDVVLAGAIWRRMYQFQEVDPEHLDTLVKYIRKQMRFLDNQSKEDIFKAMDPKIWPTKKHQ